MTDNRKTTVPGASVGADAVQSSDKITTNIITNSDKQINLQAAKKSNNFGLNTVSMTELYDTVYPPRKPIVNDLLYSGTYLFVGAPKVGKSFFMGQLAYHVAMGLPLWEYEVHQGTVLYLALEDDYARLQRRLSRMFGVEETSNLYFATQAKSVSEGLDQQLEGFIREHPDVRLIIIDTLQMVRPIHDATYANDYRDLSVLKRLADKHGIAILLIHHLRKEKAEDVFHRISGTTAISGAVDSSFTLVEEKRGSGRARLTCVGRDIEYRELELRRSEENVWELVSDSREEPVLREDRIVVLLSAFMSTRTIFIGTPTELSEKIDPDRIEGVTPKKISRLILQSIEALRKNGIQATVRRSNGKRVIELRRADSVDLEGAGEIVPIDPVEALCGDLRAVSRCGE